MRHTAALDLCALSHWQSRTWHNHSAHSAAPTWPEELPVCVQQQRGLRGGASQVRGCSSGRRRGGQGARRHQAAPRGWCCAPAASTCDCRMWRVRPLGPTGMLSHRAPLVAPVVVAFTAGRLASQAVAARSTSLLTDQPWSPLPCLGAIAALPHLERRGCERPLRRARRAAQTAGRGAA